MDLFGKQAKQELAALQTKMNGLELRHSDVVSRYNTINEELRESKALAAAINAANMSRSQHEKIKQDHDNETTALELKLKKINAQQATLQKEHDAKKTAMIREIGELQEKLDLLLNSNVIAEKKAKTLIKEITKSEKEVTKLAAKQKQLDAEVMLLQQKHVELTDNVAKLSRQQRLLTNGNAFVQQVVARVDRTGTKDELFAMMLHELQSFAEEDKASGAMQLNLAARPLLLVVDMGVKQTALAMVRGGSSFSIEAKSIIKIGATDFEKALAKWVHRRFAVQSPPLKKEKTSHFLQTAQRLFSLLCQGKAQGDIEESITIDSQMFTCKLQLTWEELRTTFKPLLGQEGSFMIAASQFLNFNNVNNEIDFIACTSTFSRFPVLQNTLSDILKRPVLLPEMPPSAYCTSLFFESEQVERQNQRENLISVNILKSTTSSVKAVKVENTNTDQVKILDDLQLADKVIFDTRTGLMWTKNGNIAGKKMTWQQAMDWVKKLNYCGHSDWRLPTENEFKIFTKKGGKPLATFFNFNKVKYVKASTYWSASTDSYVPNYAYAFYLNGGDMIGGYVNLEFKTDHHYVWPVRTG
jgi:hypothetical protein